MLVDAPPPAAGSRGLRERCGSAATLLTALAALTVLGAGLGTGLAGAAPAGAPAAPPSAAAPSAPPSAAAPSAQVAPSGAPGDPGDAYAALHPPAELSARRLATADRGAAAKWTGGQPVDAPERERRVLASVRRQPTRAVTGPAKATAPTPPVRRRTRPVPYRGAGAVPGRSGREAGQPMRPAATVAPSSQQDSRSSLAGVPVTVTVAAACSQPSPVVIDSMPRTAPVTSLPPCT